MDSNEPYPRFLEGAVRDALADTPVVVIQGARQVGKSMLVAQIADAEPSHRLRAEPGRPLATLWT